MPGYKKSLFPFPSVKDGPMFSLLKEIRQEALKYLSLSGFTLLLSWLPLNTRRSFHSVIKKYYLTGANVQVMSCISVPQT